MNEYFKSFPRIEEIVNNLDSIKGSYAVKVLSLESRICGKEQVRNKEGKRTEKEGTRKEQVRNKKGTRKKQY
jgi:hypothetical protein